MGDLDIQLFILLLLIGQALHGVIVGRLPGLVVSGDLLLDQRGLEVVDRACDAEEQGGDGQSGQNQDDAYF